MSWITKLLSFEGIVIVVAVAVGGYMIKEILTPPPPPPKVVVKEKQEPRAISRKELSECNGEDDTKPIYIAITGDVYDVSKGREKYGKGGSYHVFSGHDASLCLAKSSLDKKDLDQPTSGITYSEQETLNEWKNFFELRYEKIGFLESSDSKL